MSLSITNIGKVLSLFALAFLLSHCKTTAPTEPTAGGNSVIQVTHILDTVRGKFYDLAQANLSATPQQVLVMTADWVKTQPNVASAFWYDSTYLNITMKSGLQTMFAISVVGSDSLSLTRGGGDHSGGRLVPTTKANHTIKNKSVLIFSPFVDEPPELYHKGEIQPLVDKIRNSGKGVSVTLLEGKDCTVAAVESFGNYGLVIIDTHGLPDGFFIGQRIYGLDIKLDTTDAAIKEYVDYVIPDGYNKILKGYFRIGRMMEGIFRVSNWQQFLAERSDEPYQYRLLANASYINSLPAMPNTIIVGNMCYSGWNTNSKELPGNEGVMNIPIPIKQAFTNRNLISYYSYGFGDGTSLSVDNAFAKPMEDTLLTSLIIDGDSTGNAYLR